MSDNPPSAQTAADIERLQRILAAIDAIERELGSSPALRLAFDARDRSMAVLILKVRKQAAALRDWYSAGSP